MVWIRLISSILCKNILQRKFSVFLILLILANYFWFLNITLSSKTCHQFGLNQPTDMFDHSTESWEQGEEDRTWAGGLRRLWRPKKQRNILLPNSLAMVVLDTLFFLILVSVRKMIRDYIVTDKPTNQTKHQ